jgi:hypothetical protein
MVRFLSANERGTCICGIISVISCDFIDNIIKIHRSALTTDKSGLQASEHFDTLKLQRHTNVGFSVGLVSALGLGWG